MSELIKWFEKRRETKAFATIQRHLDLTTEIVEDLENALSAAVKKDSGNMQKYTRRVVSSEREADTLRRRVMDDISKGELLPADREDLMELVKRLDMVADWSMESTRVLSALPMDQVPNSIRNEFLVMVEMVKQCASSLKKCVDKIMTKSEEALQAADNVERVEERVDDIHEKARKLLATEDLPRAGVAILVSQLFETMEMIADACEDASDQVRVIMVRK